MPCAALADPPAPVDTAVPEPAAALRLRRELPLLQAALGPADRLALHQRLWRGWRQVDERTRQLARAWLDGRFAAFCAWMDQPWDAPATWQRLALAHLEHGPRGSGALPIAPDYVLLLLLQPQGEDHPVAAWLRLRAQVAAGPQSLSADEAAPLLSWALQAIEAGVAPQAQGLALVFDLAVRCGEPDLALQAQVQLIGLGAAQALDPAAWLRWLQGEQPLALREPMQGQWLQPRRLAQPAWRAQLRQHLRRPGVQARLARLEQALGVAADEVAGSAQPDSDAAAWRALQALDGCHALAEQGQLNEATAQAVIATGALAPAAVAALDRAVALQALESGDLALANRRLAHARAQVDDPQAREWLAALWPMLLPADDPATAQAAGQAEALARRLRDPAPPEAEDDEAAQWLALANAGDLPAALRPAALAMAARGLQAGAMDAQRLLRRCHLARAAALWRTLLDDPGHAAEARRQLDSEALTSWLPRLHDSPRPHLWTEPAPGRAPGPLLIVPACVDSRHQFAQVRGLQSGLPGHHLLHVNNPELNWYSDRVFDELGALVRQQVLPRFAPEDVCCYFGSMGGHGAMKLALAFGFSAVVFNPQIDLALWAAFRPKERGLLLGARRHASLADFPAAAWARAPMYLAFGSGTADREALSALIPLLRHAPDFQVVVEKFDDPHHAGLVKRIAQGATPAFVQQASQRLAALRTLDPGGPGWQAVPAAEQGAFWQQLDGAARLKREVVCRAGRLYWAESRHCGTRDA
ncbi:hypothetical protein BurJ1DRAFT_0160 [Burkholderiales bacterium JOSHI_001]|nr:hypothetical protein BurJ1DRAFT_0160 [Burkholderiales bacterium JOSHI_001]